MSFILNALKKAEQDRLRDDPKDLEDFASARWDPYEQKPSSGKTMVVLAFVFVAILSLVLVIYLDVLQLPSQSNKSESDSVSIPEAIEEQPNQSPLFVEPDPLALPILEISGHMYFAEGSKSNRLFANDRSFKEGELIANGWRLAAIGIDGIEMAKQERSVFVAYP